MLVSRQWVVRFRGLWLSAALCVLPPVAADSDRLFGVIEQPVPGRFSVCYDHSCATIATAGLDRQEWHRATAPLRVRPLRAVEERRAIAQSIAVFEQIIGRQFGTSADLGRNLPGMFRQGQLDCIDESTNTTTYLRMLARAGLLKFHVVERTSTRFGLFAGMPHTTAVIREIASGQRYAVDSWFLDNGQPPVIFSIEDWKAGRDPEGV